MNSLIEKARLELEQMQIRLSQKTNEISEQLSNELGNDIRNEFTNIKNDIEKHKIELRCVGHNTKVKGIESFLGIITRSNFDDFATDLSPAFDFEKFNKLLNDE